MINLSSFSPGTFWVWVMMNSLFFVLTRWPSNIYKVVVMWPWQMSCHNFSGHRNDTWNRLITPADCTIKYVWYNHWQLIHNVQIIPMFPRWPNIWKKSDGNIKIQLSRQKQIHFYVKSNVPLLPGRVFCSTLFCRTGTIK